MKSFTLLPTLLLFSIFQPKLLAQVSLVYPPLPGNLYQSDRYVVAVTSNTSVLNSYVLKTTNNWYLSAADYNASSWENHYTTFSFSGSVDIHVWLPLTNTISSVVIRPLHKGVTASIHSNEVTFKITSPGHYFVDLPGKDKYPLFIFANPMELTPPSGPSAGTLYFPPGITNVGINFTVPADITNVYLAGGAFIHGRLNIAGTSSKVKIFGRGIISGVLDSTPHSFANTMLKAPYCPLQVDDIILVDNTGHNIVVNKDTSFVSNVRMMSWINESDGICFFGNNSISSNCFFKVHDDNFHIDNNVQHIGHTVWLQRTGSVVLLGANDTQPITNVLVSNLTVIGTDTQLSDNSSDSRNFALVRLKNMEGAYLRNVTIIDVVSEVPIYQLCAAFIKGTQDSFTNGDGMLANLYLRNISLADTFTHNVFDGNGQTFVPHNGYTNDGSIKNIYFDNVTIGGVLLTASNESTYTRRSNATAHFFYLPSLSTLDSSVSAFSATTNGLNIRKRQLSFKGSITGNTSIETKLNFQISPSGSLNWLTIPSSHLIGEQTLTSPGEWKMIWNIPIDFPIGGHYDIRILASSSLGDDRILLSDIDLSKLLSIYGDLSKAIALNNPYLDQEEGILLVNLPENTKASIFQVDGKYLQTLNPFNKLLGSIDWYPHKKNGKRMPPGIYLCLLSTETESKIIKLMIAK